MYVELTRSKIYGRRDFIVTKLAFEDSYSGIRSMESTLSCKLNKVEETD